MKTTPGPWEVSPEYHGKRTVCMMRTYERVCNVQAVAENPQPATFEATEANARLIAASPDLLAALQGLMAAPGSIMAYRQADAAIRKATSPAKMKVTNLANGDYYYASEPAECRQYHEEAFIAAEYQNITIGNLKFERYEPTH